MFDVFNVTHSSISNFLNEYFFNAMMHMFTLSHHITWDDS